MEHVNVDAKDIGCIVNAPQEPNCLCLLSLIRVWVFGPFSQQWIYMGCPAYPEPHEIKKIISHLSCCALCVLVGTAHLGHGILPAQHHMDCHVQLAKGITKR